MIELALKLVLVAAEFAVEAMRSGEPIDEADRATLAKAAELAAELLERKKFGA
jgi:hypothetical protein